MSNNVWSIAFLIFIIMASCFVFVCIVTLLYYTMKSYNSSVPIATVVPIATIENGIQPVAKQDDFLF